MCIRTWFHPAEFAKKFPHKCDPASAARFRWASHVVGGLVFLLASVPIIVLSEGAFLLAVPLIAFSVLVGAELCEVLVAAALAAVGVRGIRPAASTDERIKRWKPYVQCNSSFLVLTALAYGGLACLCALAPELVFTRPYDVTPELLFAPGVCLVVWWWGALIAGLVVRGYPGPRRAAAIVLLVVATAAGIFVGVIAAVASGLLIAACLPL